MLTNTLKQLALDGISVSFGPGPTAGDIRIELLCKHVTIGCNAPFYEFDKHIDGVLIRLHGEMERQLKIPYKGSKYEHKPLRKT